MATKLDMFSATHESVTVPMDRDRKIWTALRAHHIAVNQALPCPLRKK